MAELAIASAPAATLYAHIGDQLSRLIASFGLEAARARILGAYRAIGGRSLAIPLGQRPPNFSRLNEDGTPFQLAVAIGASGSRLQLLGEAADLRDLSVRRRLRLGREALTGLAGLFGLRDSLPVAAALIERTLPPEDPALLADHAGALWLGASFAPDGEAQLKVYLNVRWGREADRWERVGAVAAALGAQERWREVLPWVRGEMEPLGAAISLARGRSLSGRIYFGAYGRPVGAYECLAGRAADPAFARQFRPFLDALLGDDCRYPLRSVVCSLGIDAVGGRDFKFELCGHCAFDGDAQARTGYLAGLSSLGLPPAGYLRMLGELSAGAVDKRRVRFHSYLGAGCRQGRVYATCYFKPDTGRP